MRKCKITVTIPDQKVLDYLNSKNVLRVLYSFKVGENIRIVPLDHASTLFMISFMVGFKVSIAGYTIKDNRDVYPTDTVNDDELVFTKNSNESNFGYN